MGVVVVALSHLGYLERYDIACPDSLVAISPPGGGESHVKIVAATDEDFRSLGMWPPPGIFPRRLLAQAVLQLSASRVPVVCLGVQLDLPTDDDAVLERALTVARQRGTDVVVAMCARAHPPTWPLPRFSPLVTTGCADLLLGPQGEVRIVASVTQAAHGSVPGMAAAARNALRRRGIARGAAATGDFAVVLHQNERPIAR